MVKLEGIQKYFSSNGVHALDGVGFELRPGEIHALLGENGAGKSTLMHIMAGYLQPDHGTILVDGTPRHFAIPRNAIKAGIGMVRQDPRMVPGFRVWEDCTVGSEQSRFGIISRTKSRELVKRVSDEWGFDLPVEDPVESLNIGQRQKAGVLALLLRNVKYIILDEPTAVLSIVETERLFYLLKKLRDEGRGIVIISHKLEETLALSNRVTVLRHGILMVSRKSRDLSMEALGSYMFGAGKTKGMLPVISADKHIVESQDKGIRNRKNILRINHLSVEDPEKPFLRGINVTIKSGRIIGFAGVRDSGLETLELSLAGFLQPKYGDIILNDKKIGGLGPGIFRKTGGAYLSADRTGTAMAYQLPLWDSLIIYAHRRSGRKWLGKLGVMDKDYLNRWADNIMKKAGVLRSPKLPGQAFSGGMIQRIILQRELAENANLFVLSEPSWGLDRHSIEKLIDELRKYAAREKSILIFSADMEFLISVSDEIIVLQNGSVSGTFRTADYAGSQGLKESIGRAMVGSVHGEDKGLSDGR